MRECERARESQIGGVALALETWDELHERLGLLALGYRRILLIELSCISCGVWRGAIEQEQEIYSCVSCQQPAKAAILCDRAFTRHPAIPWERMQRPFTGKIRDLLMMDGVFDETYRPMPRRMPDRHRRKARAVAAMAAD